jgi:3-hydroxyacyl-CoA dehydrogenase
VELKQVKNISVIGAGVMGHGIALAFALGGYRVFLNDINDALLTQAMNRIQAALDTFAEGGLIPRSSCQEALSRITATMDLKKALQEADFVTEAVLEDIAVKRKVFSEGIDLFCPEHSIIASNTSSLLLSDFSAGARRRNKIVVTHWFNPPHITPVVEVVKGPKTSTETLEITCALLQKIKKVPVKILKEVPGFIVNRLQMALIREVWSLWAQGIASPEDIDLAVKGSIGFRLACIGPLLTFDLAGLDLVYRVAENLFTAIDRSTTPPVALQKKIEAGDIGAKTGKGIFDYPAEKWMEIIKKRDQEMLQLLKWMYYSEPRK